MNEAHRIRLVLADVDGTLVTPDKTLTPRARDAVLKLADADIAFAITSGRPPRGMAPLIEPLEIRTPVFAFNGGMMVSPEMTPLEIKPIDEDLVAPIIRHLIDRGLDAWVFRSDDWLLRDASAPHAERERRTVQCAPTVTNDLESHIDGVVKLVAICDDRPTMEAAEAEIRNLYGDRVSASCSQAYYLDITHPEANKGGVIRRLARELAIEQDAIATLGDMPNDVLMFALSGLSIAMGQASQDVKRSASRVTKSNTEEGFAEAIDRYVLADV